MKNEISRLRFSRWKSFWEKQQTPIHRSDTEEFYRRHANELKSLLGGIKPASVLEIGCGNGALYEPLGLAGTDYTGVDFSDSMLVPFRADHPHLRLICADGSEYLDQRKYDLIFSNGVIQYFDRSMQSAHFANVRQMMHPGSVFLCGSIPWKAHRRRFYSGEFVSPYRPRWGLWLKSRIGAMLRGDPLGYWNDLAELNVLAATHRMTASFHPSANYIYRFHALLRPIA